MAISYRKSIGFGPVRLNVSKSGLGVSAGVKGARVGVDSRGRKYSHVSAAGFYSRKYTNKKQKSPTRTSNRQLEPKSTVLKAEPKVRVTQPGPNAFFIVIAAIGGIMLLTSLSDVGMLPGAIIFLGLGLWRIIAKQIKVNKISKFIKSCNEKQEGPTIESFNEFRDGLKLSKALKQYLDISI